MLPIGVICNSISIILGGLAAVLIKDKLSSYFKTELTAIFGTCSFAMGITAIIQMKNMPAVIFSVVVGSAIGLAVHLGDLIEKGALLMNKPFEKIAKPTDSDKAMLVTAIVLFCTSGTGIYGCLDAGMTGDHSILISKSILDFFTSLIFACQVGAVVSVIAVPQFIIFCLMFFGAGLILPHTTPAMIGDFKACGGVLLIATGLRIMNVRKFPIADMIPAMIIVMPVSWFWANTIAPLL